MLALKLGIEFTDGRTVTVTVPPAVQIAFERQYKVGIPQIADSLHLEHLYWLCFATMRRTDGIPNDFEAWLDTVAGIVDESDAADADPTTPAA